MVRIIASKGVGPENKNYIEATGLSTDTKPTDRIVTGSLFFEVDTGDVYAYNESGHGSWTKVCELGG